MDEEKKNTDDDKRKTLSYSVNSFFVFSEKLASSRFLKWMVVALLPVIIFLRYPVDHSDYDMWWQMALGKYYWAHHTLVIDQSIFSWTPADPNWIYNTCLGSIIIYFMYNAMGGFGLWVLQWLIFLGIFLSFYAALRLIKQPIDITSLTIIAATGVSCSASLSFYKPELFSPLMLCWMAVIYGYVKLKHKIFLLYTYPLIFALWVNLHGAFLLGFCLIAGFFAGEILNKIFFPQESFSTKDLFHMASAYFLSLLVALINPYGMDYLLSIYHGLTSQSLAINNKYIQAYVSVWPHLKDIQYMNVSFFNMGQNALIMVVMLLLLGSLFLYEIIKKRSCDFVYPLLVITTFIGSMWVVRTIYMFPLLFFFAFFYMLGRLKLQNITAKATVLSLIAVLLIFINVCYFTFRYSADHKWFGAGLSSYAPVHEVAFLKKYRLEGPVFNDYLIGGYLLWDLYPEYKVFIDPRLVLYHERVAPDYWDFVSRPETPEDINRFCRKYPFKVAIIHYRELPLIFDFLKAQWRLLYFERNAAILVHESLLSTIPPEVKSVDLGPMRFADEKNPEVLLNVFSLYVNLNLPASRVIYDIYKKNVSDCYKPKAEHLQVMENDIRLKELSLGLPNQFPAVPNDKI